MYYAEQGSKNIINVGIFTVCLETCETKQWYYFLADFESPDMIFTPQNILTVYNITFKTCKHLKYRVVLQPKTIYRLENLIMSA